jgi:hypothetical protein
MTGDVATIVEADAEAMLASVRAAAKTQMERALDDATRAATESWARERERWVAERAALESRAEALSALVADGEARNASLEEQLRDAEHAGALAAAETRKTRAELDEARDEQEGRFQRLRAEVKVWEDACVKYRKRMEHAERALSRLKQRAGAAGFVEATQPEENRGGAGRHQEHADGAPRERGGAPEAFRTKKAASLADLRDPPSPLALAPPPPLAPVAARKRARDAAATDAANREEGPARRDRTARARRLTSPPREKYVFKNARERLSREARPAAAEGWRRPRTAFKKSGKNVDGSRGSATANDDLWDGLWGESPTSPSRRGTGKDLSGDRPEKEKRNAAFGNPETFPPRADLRDASDRELFALGGRREKRRVDATAPAIDTRLDASRRKRVTTRDANETANGKSSEKEIKRVEVVRGALARAKLPAFACEACEKFYAATGRAPPEGKEGEACAHCPGPSRANDWSRHRARWAPPPAPRGFWNLDLTPAPRSER